MHEAQKSTDSFLHKEAKDRVDNIMIHLDRRNFGHPLKQIQSRLYPLYSVYKKLYKTSIFQYHLADFP